MSKEHTSLTDLLTTFLRSLLAIGLYHYDISCDDTLLMRVLVFYFRLMMDWKQVEQMSYNDVMDKFREVTH